MKMTTVRVKAMNPGLVTGDCTASAVVGNYTSYGQTTVKCGYRLHHHRQRPPARSAA